MGALETKISRARELFVDGDYSKSEYHEKRDTLQEEIGVVRRELSKLGDLDAERQRIENLRTALLSVEEPFSGHYVFTGDLDQLDHDVLHDHNLVYGSKETAARRRREFYRQVELRAKVGQEMEISLNIGAKPVSKLADFSCYGVR